MADSAVIADRAKHYDEAVAILKGDSAAVPTTEHLQALNDVAVKELTFLSTILAAVIISSGKDLRAFVPHEVIARLTARGVTTKIDATPGGASLLVAHHGEAITFPKPPTTH